MAKFVRNTHTRLGFDRYATNTAVFEGETHKAPPIIKHAKTFMDVIRLHPEIKHYYNRPPTPYRIIDEDEEIDEREGINPKHSLDILGLIHFWERKAGVIKPPVDEPPENPITELITEPVTEPPEEPYEEPDTDTESLFSDTEHITEPITELLTELLTKPDTEPDTEPEPITEYITESITQPITEPITEPDTEPITETITEPKPKVPQGFQFKAVEIPKVSCRAFFKRSKSGL